jgi:uncharacterized protein with PIN domain
MATVTVRVYAELNDFVAPARRQRSFACEIAGTPAVKDVIESVGVPHTEIDVILVNGESVDFAHRVGPGDRIAVYPVFEALDIAPLLRVRPDPLREVRFVLDGHLGRLARYLRMSGFDVAYSPDLADAVLADMASRERRILLTRDQELLKRRAVTHGYFVRATEPRRQLVEVLRRFDLARLIAPFTRCVACNGRLERATPEQARLAPVRRQDAGASVWVCPGCARLYWHGSHVEAMTRLLRRVQSELDETPASPERLDPPRRH